MSSSASRGVQSDRFNNRRCWERGVLALPVSELQTGFLSTGKSGASTCLSKGVHPAVVGLTNTAGVDSVSGRLQATKLPRFVPVVPSLSSVGPARQWVPVQVLASSKHDPPASPVPSHVPLPFLSRSSSVRLLSARFACLFLLSARFIMDKLLDQLNRCSTNNGSSSSLRVLRQEQKSIPRTRACRQGWKIRPSYSSI